MYFHISWTIEQKIQKVALEKIKINVWIKLAKSEGFSEGECDESVLRYILLIYCGQNESNQISINTKPTIIF